MLRKWLTTGIKVIRHLFWLGILLYGIGALLAILLVYSVSDELALVGFLAYIFPFVLAPAVLLSPLSLVAKRWRTACLLIPVAALFLWLYGTLFIPKDHDHPSDTPFFTLMTFNLDRETRDHSPVYAVIRQANADIVAVQEVTPPMLAEIEAELADIYPYMALHPANQYRSRGAQGVGILSRYPILEDDYRVIARDYQRVVLEINNTPVALYNVHMVQPLAIRPSRFRFDIHRQEVEFLLSQALADELPVILAGDFNMTDQTDDYQLVKAHFTDAFRKLGWGMGFTYPGESKNPFRLIRLPNIALLRIDYIFYNERDFSLFDIELLASGGSDHRPIRASLGLTSTQ